MQCLVLVKFLPGGSLSPDEFFSRLNATWTWLEDDGQKPGDKAFLRPPAEARMPRAAMCIAEYDSIQQLSIDLSIMPGAGISNVEVTPIAKRVSSPQAAETFLPPN